MNLKEITEMVFCWVVALVVFCLTGGVGGFLLYLFQSAQGTYKDGSWRGEAEFLITLCLSWIVATKIMYAIYPNTTVEGASPSDPDGDNPGTSGNKVPSAFGATPSGQGPTQGGQIHPRP